MRFLRLLACLCLLIVGSVEARNSHGIPDAAIERQAWWGDSMLSYVVEGCLHPTVGSTTIAIPACRAYVLTTGTPRRLQYVEETVSRNVTIGSSDGNYWVVFRADMTATPSGWTCVAGTHYCWKASTGIPATPAGAVLLSKSVVASSAVTVVGDYRNPMPDNGPINIRSALYGVAGDCTTDDTTGFQTAINAALWQKRDIYVPKAPSLCYLVDTLWLKHDATANPGAPDTPPEGQFTIFGDGATAFASRGATYNTFMTGSYANRVPGGTVIVCTSSTSNCLRMDVMDSAGGSDRQIGIHGISFKINSSAPALYFQGFVQYSSLSHVSIFQYGSGGGITLDGAYNLSMDYVRIFHHSDGSDSGITTTGLVIRNPTSISNSVSGGAIRLEHLTIQGWGGGNCLEFGSTDFSDATVINNFLGDTLILQKCNVGAFVATGARSVVFINTHLEALFSRGMIISKGPFDIDLIGTYFVDAAAGLDTAVIQISQSGLSGGEDNASNIAIIGGNWTSIPTGAFGILRHDNAGVDNLLVMNVFMNKEAAATGTVGISCSQSGGDPLEGITLINNDVSNMDTGYRNCGDVALLVNTDYVRVARGFSIGTDTTVQAKQWFQDEKSIDFGSIPANSCVDSAGQTLTGITTGMYIESVRIPPNLFGATGLTWTIGITANDTWVVRGCNHTTSASADPSASTFGLTVVQYE